MLNNAVNSIIIIHAEEHSSNNKRKYFSFHRGREGQVSRVSMKREEWAGERDMIN